MYIPSSVVTVWMQKNRLDMREERTKPDEESLAGHGGEEKSKNPRLPFNRPRRGRHVRFGFLLDQPSIQMEARGQPFFSS